MSQASVLENVALVLRPMPVVTIHWAGADELPAGCETRLLWERLATGPEPATVAGGGSSAAKMVREALRGGPLPYTLREGKAQLAAEPGERLQLRVQLQQDAKSSELIALSPIELDTATFVDGQTIELRADAAAFQAALQKTAAR